MRMYIPRRIEVANVPGVGIRFPYLDNGRWVMPPTYLAGAWADREAGYFRQITRGQPFNDVLHASLSPRDVGKVESPHFEFMYRGQMTLFPSYGGVTTRNAEVNWHASSDGTVVYGVKVNVTGNILSGYRITSMQIVVTASAGRPDGNRYRYAGSAVYGLSAGYSGWASWTINSPSPDLVNKRYGPIFNPDDKYSTGDDAYSNALRIGMDLAISWGDAAKAWVRSNLATASRVSGYDVGHEIAIPNGALSFVFGEQSLSEGIDPILVGRQLPSASYWRNWLVQHAYLDALQSIPKLNDNSVSNIMEIVGFMKALIVDHKIEIPKRLQDAWLSYRYVYTTTKLDAEEALSFVKRYYGLDGFSKGFVSYGQSSTTVLGNRVTCKCRFDVKSRELGTLDKIWRALYTYGLQPNFYLVWDMIPYSFIVDWFLPVGDIASVLDTEANTMRGQYDINNVVFSLSYENTVDAYKHRCYYRWCSPPLTQLNEFYWFDRPKTSTKTLLFRVFDSASLIVGR